MFGLLSVLFVVIFAMAVINIVFGMWGTARLSGKVFQLVEKQLDQQLVASQSIDTDQHKTIECAHCGGSVAQAEKCPNCGASLV